MKKSTTTPLRISFVYDDSLDGWEGVSQYVKTLGGWLQSRGHRVSYLVGESANKDFLGSPIYSLAKNVAVNFNGNRLSMPWYARSTAINRAIEAQQPQILHIQVPYSPFMAQKIINRRGSAVVVGTFHIYPASHLVRFASKLLKVAYGRSLKKFAAMVSVSEPAQSFAQTTFGIKSAVIPNMVDIEKFLGAKTAFTPYKIVFLGRLVERKGCAYLIKAFAQVANNHQSAKLVIAGDGPQRQDLENLAAELGITNKVEFTGFVGEVDKPKLLASAHIACFPSLYGESFGIVLVEAMAAGAGAVIGGSNPGYSYVLENPETLFDPNNVDELIARIDSLLKDEKKLAQIHKQQAELVKKYDVNVVGRQIETLYRTAIANSNETGDNNS